MGEAKGVKPTTQHKGRHRPNVSELTGDGERRTAYGRGSGNQCQYGYIHVEIEGADEDGSLTMARIMNMILGTNKHYWN
jgi:hypothetical protein